ncbi:hypothetical protein AVEN_73885-1 [Araneus ventricosus]|uniref:Uncharacterized protein n=1 Tax=Araneus ventricosus TaxID=182803 RepID=A0A4Y2R6M6_ARAVE|nr:hypothetical protein AVEN_73885-1 [Araneus ventricosus]
MDWQLHAKIVDRFANRFYPGSTDARFIQEFLHKYHPLNWLIIYERPKVLEFFLRHLQDGGKKIDEALLFPILLSDLCILKSLFLNVGPIVKFTLIPEISALSRDLYMSEIWVLR